MNEKKRRVDGHVHTNHCDGALPEEVAEAADELGISAVTITDHHETTGIDAVREAAKKRGSELEVIAGIELTTLPGFDILGYFIEYENNEFFRSELDRIQAGRKIRERKITEALNDFFRKYSVELEMDFDAVLGLTINGNVAGGHIEKFIYEQIKGMYESDRDRYEHVMKALIGGINDSTEAGLAFDPQWDMTANTSCKIIKEDLVRSYLLKRGSPCHVQRTPEDCFGDEEAINLILQARGVPVIAHPGGTNNDVVMYSVMGKGIEGLEVFSTKHTPEQNAHYSGIAMDRGLVGTAGSDWHGKEFSPHLKLGQIGTLNTGNKTIVIEPDYSMFTRILHRKDRMMKKGKFNVR